LNKKEVTKAHLVTKKAILVNNLHPTLKLPITIKYVKSLVSKVIHGEDCRFNEISVNFVKNSDLRRINRKYLKHNYNTDIITFPYNSNRKNIEGEIFISLDTVKENGKFYGSGYKMELKRVLIHGSLHLTGYKDGTKKEKELITKKENYYLGN
jgi:rRNA maturation RNase YbeY